MKEIGDLTQALNEMMNKTDQLKEGSVQTMQQLQTSNKDLKQQVEKLQCDLIETTNVLNKLRDVHNNDISGWQSKVRLAETEGVNKSNEINGLKNETNTLKNEVSRLKNQSEYKDKCIELSLQVENLENDLRTLNLNMQEKEEEISKLNLNILNLSVSEQSKLQSLQSQVSQLELKVSELQSSHHQQTKQIEERVRLESTSEFDNKINRLQKEHAEQVVQINKEHENLVRRTSNEFEITRGDLHMEIAQLQQQVKRSKLE